MSFNDSQSRKGLNPNKDEKPPISDAEALYLASKIADILQGQSHRTAQKALAAVAAIHNLKVMEINKPIGLAQGSSNQKAGRGNSQAQKPKGGVRKDSVLDNLAKERSGLVASVKVATDFEKDELVSKLRTVEAQIRNRKASIANGTAATTSAAATA
jgi:hypothetical protein